MVTATIRPTPQNGAAAMWRSSREKFAQGVLARQAALRYFKEWCRLCGIRPKEAATILRMLTEAKDGELQK